jgi:hypothetical protein
MISEHPIRSLPAAERLALDALVAADDRLAPDDPDAFAVHDGGRLIGAFALRGLNDHALGRRLASYIGGPRQLRFPGPHGFVHALALADGFDLPQVERVFAAIARRSLARMYGTIFFCGAERRVAGVLRKLGVEMPADLAATGIAPVIGAYQPARPENLARLSRRAA